MNYYCQKTSDKARRSGLPAVPYVGIRLEAWITFFPDGADLEWEFSFDLFDTLAR